MPQWLKDEMIARGGNMTADQMARLTVQHSMSGTVKMEMPRGNERGVPLYVYVINDTPQYTDPGIPGRAYGGIMLKYSGGSDGSVRGPGGPMSDLIPAMLSNGEYVIRASSVDKFGVEFFDLLNKGMLPEFGRGGSSKYPSMIRNMGMGGAVYYNKGGFVNESSSNVEYNINVSVAGSNASADEIAREVMSAINRKEQMSKTVNRI